MTGSRPYYPQLDGVRAIAVALVIIGHQLFEVPGGAFETLGAEWAALGVLVFFVLSGFLITTLLCNEEARTGRIALGAFYARRALRILPAMYTLLGVTALLALGGYVTDVKWSNFGAAAFYVRNLFGSGWTLAHLWSLSLEEQFYLSWPFMMIVTPKNARLRMALITITLITTWRAAALSLHLFSVGVVYERTDFRFDSILAGCALALALRSLHGRSRFAALKFVSPVVLLPALLCLVVLPVSAWFLPFSLTVQTLLVTALIARVIVIDSDVFARALSLAPMRWLGRLSYSWYLWQQLFVVTRTPSWGVLRQFPLDIVASFAAALASYYIVERPFLRWKDALARDAKVTAPVTTSGTGGVFATPVQGRDLIP